MNNIVSLLLMPAGPVEFQFVIGCMRIGIGILTIGHGWPKLMGGFPMWQELGTFMYPLGIYFLPVMWGFLGACIEFFGGIALVLGLGTRVASAALTCMMIVALVWHLNKGDSYNVYSFPLSLIVVFLGFMCIGGGTLSLDYYLAQR